MITRLTLCLFMGALLLVGSVATPPDLFVAKRACILHTQDSGGSPSVGRLEVGERAPIIESNAAGNWVKIRHDGVEGWVFKSRGQIVQDDAAEPENGEMGFFFGNIHAHTSEESSESGVSESTHEDAFAFAMDDNLGDLDFLAITPHNHLVSDQAYPNLLLTVVDAAFNRPGQFVPIAGQEYSSTSTGNHLNLFEVDAWVDPILVENGAYDVLFNSFIPAHQTGLTFGQFNHPHSVKFGAHNGTEYGRDDFLDNNGDTDMAAWIAATDPVVQGIEVISAPSHTNSQNRPHKNEHTQRLHAWLWALSQGWHLGPTANQDNHRPNWGTGSDSRTVAVAPELTRAAICEAFRQRRFYASEDSTLEVTFRAGDQWMGSIVQASELEDFVVTCHDPKEPSAEYAIELHMGEIGGSALKLSSTPVDTLTLLDNEEGTFFPEPLGGTFWFIRVTQSQTADDSNSTADDAWTAPIWVEGMAH